MRREHNIIIIKLNRQARLVFGSHKKIESQMAPLLIWNGNTELQCSSPSIGMFSQSLHGVEGIVWQDLLLRSLMTGSSRRIRIIMTRAGRTLEGSTFSFFFSNTILPVSWPLIDRCEWSCMRAGLRLLYFFSTTRNSRRFFHSYYTRETRTYCNAEIRWHVLRSI
jgi:hypothetical protein